MLDMRDVYAREYMCLCVRACVCACMLERGEGNHACVLACVQRGGGEECACALVCAAARGRVINKAANSII